MCKASFPLCTLQIRWSFFCYNVCVVCMCTRPRAGTHVCTHMCVVHARKNMNKAIVARHRMTSKVSKIYVLPCNSLSHRIKEGLGEESPLVFDLFPGIYSESLGAFYSPWEKLGKLVLTENSKLIPFVMLEVLIHFYWKNLYICHVAPGLSEVGFVLLQGEVCFAPSSTGRIYEVNRVCVGFVSGKVLMRLPFWTLSIVFVIHRFPDSMSFTFMTVTQENERFKHRCSAFEFLS